MTPELYKFWYNGGQLQWRHAKGEVLPATKWYDLEPRNEKDSLFITKGFEFRIKREPHKHAELIKAWADGAEIEYFDPDAERWVKAIFPSWSTAVKYRIKQESWR